VKKYIPAIIVFILMVLVSAHFYRLLPDMIATHFDLQGQPTDYSPKLVAISILPGLYFVLLLGLPLLMKSMPVDNQTGGSNLVARTMFGLGLMLLCIHYGMLNDSLKPAAVPFWISIGIGIFMISMASTLESSTRNYFIGIRTPWSMASDANWKATHRFAAKMMGVTGFLILVAALLARASLVITVASLLFATIIPAFYSYWYSQNVEKKP
jgi:uncharacterized membrane protein